MRADYRTYLFQSQKEDLFGPWTTAEQAIDKLDAVCADGCVLDNARTESIVGLLQTFYLVGNAAVINRVERPTPLNRICIKTAIYSRGEPDSDIVDKFKDLYKSEPEIRDSVVVI